MSAPINFAYRCQDHGGTGFKADCDICDQARHSSRRAAAEESAKDWAPVNEVVKPDQVRP